uniref:Uncharacterized protein n=1 Tax=viral metagenome TaxID=1070528 RepID=A0A6C0E4G1_9ZZZZ
MSGVIITSTTLKNILEQGQLKVARRKQRNNDDSYNYFISPKLMLEFHNGRVIYAAPTYIVIEYQKLTHIGLLCFLRYVSECFTRLVKPYVSNDKKIYNIYLEKEDTFSIRCHLPKKGSGYTFKVVDSQTKKEISYSTPNKNVIIDYALVDIKNLWESSEKIGFNLEVRQLEY